MIRQRINRSVNRQRMGHASNEGMADRKNVRMNQLTSLLRIRQINEGMG